MNPFSSFEVQECNDIHKYFQIFLIYSSLFDQESYYWKMFAGDIFSCQKNLSVLLKQKPSVDEKTIDELGKMIVKFSEDSFIPVEYSEKILTSTGNLMERCSQHGTLERFAASATFTNALVSIICDFGTRISVDSGNVSPSSFSSHYCYELSLFMLLGLLDKSPILRIFVRVTDEAVVTKLMKSLCVTITKDYAYLTQVIICNLI